MGEQFLSLVQETIGEPDGFGIEGSSPAPPPQQQAPPAPQQQQQPQQLPVQQSVQRQQPTQFQQNDNFGIQSGQGMALFIPVLMKNL